MRKTLAFANLLELLAEGLAVGRGGKECPRAMRREQRAPRFRHRFDQVVIVSANECAHGVGNNRIIDCASGVIAQILFGRQWPKVELLDMNAIDHGNWNFGDNHILRRGQFLSSRAAGAGSAPNYFGASESTIFSKRGSPRIASKYGCRRRWP